MNERPLLFSDAMIRAILAGRKTQTRRILSPQPDTGGQAVIGEYGTARGAAFLSSSRGGQCQRVPCPYGAPGDRLWVREAWRIGAWDDDRTAIAVDYRADRTSRREWLTVPDPVRYASYRLQCVRDAQRAGCLADGNGRYHWPVGRSPCRWRPSIHMPRYASRILLEIERVRVERLQQITRDDATAEGIISTRVGAPPIRATVTHWEDWPTPKAYDENPVSAFRGLWDEINAGRGLGWDQNPWVWVVEFRVLKQWRHT